jgi:uncharacterized protein involved in exopolysaccharide biosynthesis/MinD-like ATPase involved in chromosome partitioning or flagellar assembly
LQHSHAREGRERAEADDGLSDMPWNVSRRPAPSGDADPGSARGSDLEDLSSLAAVLGGEESRDSEGLRGLDVGRFAFGLYRRRYLVVALTAVLTVIAVTGVQLLVQKEWRAAVALVKRSQVDEFSVEDAETFKPETYNLRTLLDTVKLPSSLDRVLRATQVEATRLQLVRALGIGVGSDSSVVTLSVTWDDPQTAARLANDVAAELVETSRTIRRRDAEETYAYYSAQYGKVSQEVQAVDEKVLAFQRAHGVSNFDAEVKVRLAELSRIETEYRELRAEVEAKRRAESRLRRAIDGEPEMVVTYSVFRNPLQQRLSEYEWQLREAKSRYTAKNPKVVKIQKRIDVLKQLIDENADEAAPENTFAPNEKRQELELRRHELEDEIQIDEARAAALKGTLESVAGKLSFLSEKEKEFIRLKSSQEAAHRLRSRLAAWSQEAQVLVERNEASFAIVEPATPPVEPLPSGKRVFAAAGGMLSLAFALGVALALELLEGRARTGTDVARAAKLRVVLEWRRAPGKEGGDAGGPDFAELLAFRRLINALATGERNGPPAAVAVVGIDPGDGRSAVAIQLAQAIASKEQPTLLVDADMDCAGGTRVSQRVGLGDAAGLREVLAGTQKLSQVVRATDSARLRVVPAGCSGAGAEADVFALGGRRMAALVAALDSGGGSTVYDLPPCRTNEAALELAVAIGKCVLVVASGATERADIEAVAEQLRDRGADLAAAVVTDVPEARSAVERTLVRVFGSTRFSLTSARGWEPNVHTV